MAKLKLHFRDSLHRLVNENAFFAYFYSFSSFLFSKLMIYFCFKYDALILNCNAIIRIKSYKYTVNHINFISKNYSIPIYKNLYFNNYMLNNFYLTKSCNLSLFNFNNECINDRVRLRYSKLYIDDKRQGNLIILKKPCSAYNEKGIILLKYNEAFDDCAALFDLNLVCARYRFVFEPSSYRNIVPSLFLYAASGGTHVFQASQESDRILLNLLLPSLKTIDLNSGDWVDYRVFNNVSIDKLYDVVMVASWARLKRHGVLFSALRKLNNKGVKLRCALVGYPLDLNQNDIVALAESYGVRSNLVFFECIPASDVAKILASSKVAVHLSLAEGANKASYEALMCDVPIIVYKNNEGFRRGVVNSDTGLFSDDDDLDLMIQYVINHRDKFSPRSWMMKNGGFVNATQRLNDFLRQIAYENGEGWSADIVPKINMPNLYYAFDNDRLNFDSAYEELKSYLRLKV